MNKRLTSLLLTGASLVVLGACSEKKEETPEAQVVSQGQNAIVEQVTSSNKTLESAVTLDQPVDGWTLTNLGERSFQAPSRATRLAVTGEDAEALLGFASQLIDFQIAASESRIAEYQAEYDILAAELEQLRNSGAEQWEIETAEWNLKYITWDIEGEEYMIQDLQETKLAFSLVTVEGLTYSLVNADAEGTTSVGAVQIKSTPIIEQEIRSNIGSYTNGMPNAEVIALEGEDGYLISANDGISALKVKIVFTEESIYFFGAAGASLAEEGISIEEFNSDTAGFFDGIVLDGNASAPAWSDVSLGQYNTIVPSSSVVITGEDIRGVSDFVITLGLLEEGALDELPEYFQGADYLNTVGIIPEGITLGVTNITDDYVEVVSTYSVSINPDNLGATMNWIEEMTIGEAQSSFGLTYIDGDFEIEMSSQLPFASGLSRVRIEDETLILQGVTRFAADGSVVPLGDIRGTADKLFNSLEIK